MWSIGWDHLPIRVAQHGALPIDVIRASTLLFGESLTGVRTLSVVAGVATLVLLYLIVARWWGRSVGLIAAALLMAERYHATISGRAIDLPLDLFFVALAMFAFSRFLDTLTRPGSAVGRSRWLYLTAASCALGFLCKELTGIMLLALLATFVALRRTDWLLRRQPWLAAALFLVLVSPDFYASFTAIPADRSALWDKQKESILRMRTALQRPEIRTELEEDAPTATGLFMSHGDQLSRFRSVGFNSEPFYFYFGGLLDGLGIQHVNNFVEFPFLHPAMGILLWAGVLSASLRSSKDSLTIFCLTMFVVAFVPFALVELGEPRGKMATDGAMLWYWGDRTMLPAMLLTAREIGRWLQRLRPTSTFLRTVRTFA